MKTQRKFSSLSRGSLPGFTLIELLTVIAIIGILAAIIIPTVGTVRQTAREARNINNVRQISLALNTYAGENRELFPWAGNSTPTTAGVPVQPHWKSTLYRYLTPNNSGEYTRFVEDSVFSSPTAANPRATAGQPCHYSLAPAFTTAQGVFASGRISRNRVTRPSQIILVADGSQSDSNGENAAETFYNPTQTVYGNGNPLTDFIPATAAQNVDTVRGVLRYRNRNSVHVGMVDGSARSIKMGSVTYGHIVPYQ